MEATATRELQQELSYFERSRLELLARVPGKYALIKGSKLVGTFDSESEAVGAGYRQFGNESFLVKHIVEADLPLTFATFNLGAQLRVFESSVPDLYSAGPVVQVSVGPSREMINALAPLGAVLHSPFAVTALIDTGAYTTVLNPETIARLGLKPVGVAPITTPSTTAPVMCSRYHINVYFSDDVVVENIFAIEAPMGGVPYHCLIGRDVLRGATLLYEGRANRYTLTL